MNFASLQKICQSFVRLKHSFQIKSESFSVFEEYEEYQYSVQGAQKKSIFKKGFFYMENIFQYFFFSVILLKDAKIKVL